MAAILPRVYPQMLDEVHAHQDAGRPDLHRQRRRQRRGRVAGRGARDGGRHRHPLRGRRRGQLHRPPRRALRLRPRQGRRRWSTSPPRTRSTSPPPTPTPTRSRTCRCCARSATRSRSTPTRRWPRSPRPRTGRRCASSASAAASPRSRSPLLATLAGIGASRVAARRRPPPRRFGARPRAAVSRSRLGRLRRRLGPLGPSLPLHQDRRSTAVCRRWRWPGCGSLLGAARAPGDRLARRDAGRSCAVTAAGSLAFAVVEIAIPFPMIAAGETARRLLDRGDRDRDRAADDRDAQPPLRAGRTGRRPATGRPRSSASSASAPWSASTSAATAANCSGSAPASIAACGYAIGPMILKRQLVGLDPTATMGGCLAIAAVVLTPFALLDPAERLAELPAPSPRSSSSASSARRSALVLMAILIGEAGPARALGHHLRQPGDRARPRRRLPRRGPGRRLARRPGPDPGRLLGFDRRPGATVRDARRRDQ